MVIVMGIINKIRTFAYSTTILYLLVGLLMLLNPSFVANAFNYIIGILIMIYGLMYIINLYNDRDKMMFNKFNFLAGLVCIVFGLYLILNPTLLQSLIPFCCGVILFMDSVYQLRNGFKLKNYQYKYWYINIIVGLIYILAGGLIIVYSKQVNELIIRIIGGIFIFDAIMDLYTFLTVRKFVRDVKKIVTKEE